MLLLLLLLNLLYLGFFWYYLIHCQSNVCTPLLNCCYFLLSTITMKRFKLFNTHRIADGPRNLFFTSFKFLTVFLMEIHKLSASFRAHFKWNSVQCVLTFDWSCTVHCMLLRFLSFTTTDQNPLRSLILYIDFNELNCFERTLKNILSSWLKWLDFKVPNLFIRSMKDKHFVSFVLFLCCVSQEVLDKKITLHRSKNRHCLFIWKCLHLYSDLCV